MLCMKKIEKRADRQERTCNLTSCGCYCSFRIPNLQLFMTCFFSFLSLCTILFLNVKLCIVIDVNMLYLFIFLEEY